MTSLDARPEPVDIALDRTAVIVVDMQNAFVSKGGMFDLAGFDISGAAAGSRRDTAPAGGKPPGRREGDLSPDVVPAGPRRRRRRLIAELPQGAGHHDDAAAPGARAASFWSTTAGTGRSSRRCSRSRATMSSANPATAASAAPIWKRISGPATSATCCSPASPPMSASKAPRATPTSRNSGRSWSRTR